MRIRVFVLFAVAVPLSAAEDKARDLIKWDTGRGVMFDSVPVRHSNRSDPALKISPAPGDGILITPLSEDPETVLSARVSLEWHRAVFGTGVGDAGMAVADIDADGDLELVASAGEGGLRPNTFWYVLEWDGQDYVHRWTSLPFEGRIDRLLVAQLDRDSALEVVLLYLDSILVYDGMTFALEMVRPVLPYMSGVADMALANVDDDPAVEAIVCNRDGTWVYELESGCEQFFRDEYPCSGLAVGEIDGTPGTEIVLANGRDPGFVLDGPTGDMEWTNIVGFGESVEVGDVDADSLGEIVAGHSWSGISVWNGDTQEIGWEASFGSVAAVTVADVEGDGPLEVIFAEPDEEAVRVLDGQSGAEKFSIDYFDYRSPTGLVVADADWDGVAEIVIGTGRGSLPGPTLVVADTADRALEWESINTSGPFYGLAHGDVDDDGDPELVYTTFESDNGWGDGLYFVHDAATKQLEFQRPKPTGSNSTGLWSVQVADVQGDGALEIFLPASVSYNGLLQCIDGATHELWWQTEFDGGTTFPSLQLADLEGDGSIEVVSGSEMHFTVGRDTFIFAFDAVSGEQKWKSPNLDGFFGNGASLTLLRVADIDGDGTGEILVAEPGQGLLALDPVDGTIDLSVSGVGVTALEVGDLDSDGVPDIIIGTDSGFLRRVSADSGDTIALAGPYAAPVDAVAVAEITDDEVADYVICTADRIHLIDGATGNSLWVSVDLGSGVGHHDSLVVGDLDLDGRVEIWVNAGWIGHMIFEVEIYERSTRWRRNPGARRVLPGGEPPECPPG